MALPALVGAFMGAIAALKTFFSEPIVQRFFEHLALKVPPFSLTDVDDKLLKFVMEALVRGYEWPDKVTAEDIRKKVAENPAPIQRAIVRAQLAYDAGTVTKDDARYTLAGLTPPEGPPYTV